MQANHAVGVIKTLKKTAGKTKTQTLGRLDAVARPESPDKLDQVLRLLEDSLHLQRVALLEPGHVLRFSHDALTQVALCLPEAVEDYTQKSILKNRSFHRTKLLAAVQSMGLIGPETTVCDIGANIGNDAVCFGRVLGARRIVAFEPLPLTHATLRRNLDLNGLGAAHAYNCMLGEVSGRGRVVRFNPRNLAATSFAPSDDGPIPMVALDDLIDAEEFQGLGFVKLDAEGDEIAILRGGAKVLATLRPALWLTLREGALAQAEALLQPLGYSARSIGAQDHIFTVK
ncbi:MAG: FkbM family methyltransferase [Rhodobacteraceae bacterium]|nr:FkbM family methyltransferase [Paracoccaceae bacterium]